MPVPSLVDRPRPGAPPVADPGSPLSIGLVAPPWLPVPPAGYGGTESVLDGLARGLRAAGHRVVLWTTGDASCPVTRRWSVERSLGIDAIRPETEAAHVVEAYGRLGDVDIVHDHTVVGPLYAAGRFRVPLATTNHGPFDAAAMAVYRALAADVALVAISRHQAGTAGDLPIAAVIPHGLDVGGVPYGDGAGGYAAFVGRMSPDKGIVEAVGAARAAGVPLLIAAKMREPAERAYFRAVVQPLLGGGVEYVGELGAPDKYRLMGGACCLLNPIQWPEPFGMVMIESLATGTPVVTTARGAAPEIVDDGATGVVATSAEGLVDGIRRAAELCRRRCRSEAERRFSHHRMAEDHVALYRRLLAGRSASGAVGAARRGP